MTVRHVWMFAASLPPSMGWGLLVRAGHEDDTYVDGFVPFAGPSATGVIVRGTRGADADVARSPRLRRPTPCACCRQAPPGRRRPCDG
jgi:hypothetical protein